MYTTYRLTNIHRKKELIIRKIKNTHLEDKHKDDEEIALENQYIEDSEDNQNPDNKTTNTKICPNFVLTINKKTWTMSDGGEMKTEFPASTCKLIKPQKDKPVIVSCRGYVQFCDKKELDKKKESRKGEDKSENESKIAIEIKKVKKNQKQKKEEGE